MVSQEFHFDAPWGRLLKVITALLTLLLLGLFSWMAFSGRAETRLQTVLYIILPLAVILGSMLFMVRGYSITESGISIRRLLWNTSIELGVIKRVEHDPGAMKGAIRTWGNGGFYSFSGRFRSTRLGPFRAYVTDYGNCVVIETLCDTVVVSPENPMLFQQILQRRIRS